MSLLYSNRYIIITLFISWEYFLDHILPRSSHNIHVLISNIQWIEELYNSAYKYILKNFMLKMNELATHL